MDDFQEEMDAMIRSIPEETELSMEELEDLYSEMSPEAQAEVDRLTDQHYEDGCDGRLAFGFAVGQVRRYLRRLRQIAESN